MSDVATELSPPARVEGREIEREADPIATLTETPDSIWAAEREERSGAPPFEIAAPCLKKASEKLSNDEKTATGLTVASLTIDTTGEGDGEEGGFAPMNDLSSPTRLFFSIPPLPKAPLDEWLIDMGAREEVAAGSVGEAAVGLSPFRIPANERFLVTVFEGA